MTDFASKTRQPTPKDQLWERLDKSSALLDWTAGAIRPAMVALASTTRTA